MARWLALHLGVQALLAGAAVLLMAMTLAAIAFEESPVLGLAWAAWVGSVMRWVLLASLVAHGAFVVLGRQLSPPRRSREYARTHRLITHGPFARRHWVAGVFLGIIVPAVLLLIPDIAGSWHWWVAASLALVGLHVEEDILVRAGQALPIS